MRAVKGVEPARADLQAALKDESPSVQIAAARALGQYGPAEDLKLVLPVLQELASPAKNGPFASLEALTAIDALGAKAASLKEALAAMPARDPKAAGRNAEYTERMMKEILQGQGQNNRGTRPQRATTP